MYYIIISVQGIELCSKLEELTLDDNFITQPIALHHFINLQWLSIANNNLHSLPHSSTGPLLHLTYINVSGNRIDSLNELEVSLEV